MVSYYNTSMYHQKGGPAAGMFPHHGSPPASWYSNYNAPGMHQMPPTAAQQYLNCMQDQEQLSGAWHHHHHPVFHQGSSPDWAPSGEFANPSAASILQQQSLHHFQGLANHGEHSDPLQIPSPPITVSGSELSSPGAHIGSSSPLQGGRPTPVRSPYEWMKKPSYQSQPNPGKTRTKDKYRVVYSDHQRLELEKEFHYSRYITIRRKAELANNLALSERQVKIWFQNRRAKERKQVKKREEVTHKDIKMDPASLQLQHSALHQQMVSSSVPGSMPSALHVLHHYSQSHGNLSTSQTSPQPSSMVGPPSVM